MDKTLLIMAAGLASRYGGNKQTDSFGPNGEMLMEYSVADAKKAGFTKVVFVIAPSMRPEFEEKISGRISKIKLSFAIQSFSTLPEWFAVPEGRVRPYGTTHAILSAREYINEPFVVINADDYYGEGAYLDISRAMEQMPESGGACMLTYRLENTLSGIGKVTRGICEVEQGILRSITETYETFRAESGEISGVSDGCRHILQADAPTSMNIFGFTPWIFDELEREFNEFLRSEKSREERGELPLPLVLDRLICSGRLTISAAPTTAQWLGVTYQEDKEQVRKRLIELYGN